jgi:hypothetical protein
MNVRFMSSFRDGAFLTIYRQGSLQTRAVISDGFHVDSVDGELRTKAEYDDGVARGFYINPAERHLQKMKPGEDFSTEGFYFDPVDHRVHRICVEEVKAVYSAVSVGGNAWFAGLTDGKAAMVGISERDRVIVRLPQEDEIPDLGMDGQSLLAVYSRAIYRLANRNWVCVHSGDILLPRSGLPPQRYGSKVFLRDEGTEEGKKRLWWLTIGTTPHLSILNHDVGSLDAWGPDWDKVSAYHLTNSGDLWICVGNSLVRRSMEGSYAIAILEGSVQFRGDLFDPGVADQDLFVSAITLSPDGALLLAGDTGLYRLECNELTQKIAFSSEATSDANGKSGSRWYGTPTSILVLDDTSYLIGCGSWNGVYLLRKGADGRWSCVSVELGEPVVW